MRIFTLSTIILFLNTSYISNSEDKSLQKVECNCNLYQIYISDDMNQWPKAIEQLKLQYKKTNHSLCLFSLAFAQYGYTGFLIGEKRAQEARESLKETENSINELNKRKAYPSRVKALSGAVLGFHIALSPSKAVFYGPKSLSYINEAISIDSLCPYGWVEKANAEFHMPRVFGGSYDKAAAYYQRAIQLFEKDKEYTHCNWYYLNTYFWMGKSYELAEKKDVALRTFKKLQQIEPKFKRANQQVQLLTKK
jgi:tetratricopeptide (TPR) repeat protein